MSQLDDLVVELTPLGALFTRAGHSLYLVGGIVRDGMLGTLPPLGDPQAGDIDLTTDAWPDQILEILRPLASALWTQGERFGTIGATINGRPVEITTHRAEVYDEKSRKPVVSFGDDLETDLSRRDFTINAMAVRLPDGALFDPYGGAADLSDQVLRTPLDPRISFTDDPLRMLRAARFIPRFKLNPDPDLVAAAIELHSRIEIVSVERVHDELERLLGVDDPTIGLRFAEQIGLLAAVLGPHQDDNALALGIKIAASGGDNLERRARLLAPFGRARAADILRRLRYSNDDRAETVSLLQIQEWLATATVATPTLRRATDMVRGSGADKKVSVVSAALALGSDLAPDETRFRQLSELLAQLEQTEDLASMDGPFDGAQLMDRFNLSPGPIVGNASRYQRELRYEQGPITEDAAATAIGAWLADQG